VNTKPAHPAKPENAPSAQKSRDDKNPGGLSDKIAAPAKSGEEIARQHLRKIAEERFAERPPIQPDKNGCTPEQIVHELQVHQIELEMQNEALRDAQQALEESRDKYSDLYEFAPVGYLTLTKYAIIEEGNLTCATILGIERRKLIKSSFGKFVSEGYLEQ
jgi:hypothetical protein